MLNISSLNAKKFFFSFSFKNIKLVKILFILFTFGFVFGAILIGFNHEEVLKQLAPLVHKYIQSKTVNLSFFSFFYSFFGFSFLILILFVVGFVPIGQPIAFFMPLFHGLGLGLCTSYLYSANGIKGFLFCILLIAPFEIIYSITLILACKSSIQLSNRIFKNILFGRIKYKIKEHLKRYFLRYLIFIVFLVAATIVDFLSNLLFLKFVV